MKASISKISSLLNVITISFLHSIPNTSARSMKIFVGNSWHV